MNPKTWRITNERMTALAALARSGNDQQALAVLADILAQHAAQTRSQADQATAALRDLRILLNDDTAGSAPDDQPDA